MEDAGGAGATFLDTNMILGEEPASVGCANVSCAAEADGTESARCHEAILAWTGVVAERMASRVSSPRPRCRRKAFRCDVIILETPSAQSLTKKNTAYLVCDPARDGGVLEEARRPLALRRPDQPWTSIPSGLLALRPILTDSLPLNRAYVLNYQPLGFVRTPRCVRPNRLIMV